MKKLAALIALFCFSAALAPAATIYVSKTATPDATHANTIADGFTKAQFGDTVEITDSAIYDEGDFYINQKNLTCSANPPATIKCSTKDMRILNLNWNCDVSNLILEGNDAWPGVINIDGGITNISNCTIINRNSQRGTVHFNTNKDETVNFIVAKIEYCYLIDGNLQFEGNGKLAAGVTNQNSVLFNHCTVSTHDNVSITAMGNNWCDAGQSVEFKNSILGTHSGSPIAVSWGTRIFYYSGSDVTESMINHHHNLYTGYWQFAHSDSTGVDDPTVPDPAKGEVRAPGTGTNGDTILDPFKDIANLDLSLKPGTDTYVQPARCKADDGENIGADIITVPVELSSFSAE